MCVFVHPELVLAIAATAFVFDWHVSTGGTAVVFTIVETYLTPESMVVLVENFFVGKSVLKWIFGLVDFRKSKLRVSLL